MVVFDIVVLIILLLFCLKGLKNGFVKELASLAALILGVAAAVVFSDLAAGLLEGVIKQRYISTISFIIVFIAAVIVVHIVANAIDALMKAVALGWLNRIAGALFAIFKAAFFLGVILIIIDSVGLKERIFSEDITDNSLLYRTVSDVVPFVLAKINISMDHLILDLEEFKESFPYLS
ncbi:CvpA family protein [Marinilabiliaceae bacterium ANBcel2]|nr:CvpA family protein [Marinilabiliaceae bacterium ANBcel2]